MKTTGSRLSAMVAIFALVLFTAPAARADGVDDKIQALEQELMELKAEQQQVREEQIELKKQATEAAAALPTVTYRPRAGMTIAGADKSWAFNIGSQFHLRLYNHTDGNDARGAQSGKLFGRRMTLFPSFCWADCFYDFDLWIDMDTGNIPLELQRAKLDFHFEQFNPFLPTLRIGLDTPASKAHLTSSSSSARWERNTVNDDSNISLTGSHQGIGLVWDEVPIGISTFDLESHLVTGRLAAGDGASTASDRMAWIGYTGTKPFGRTKNKWLNGFEFRFEVQLESVDDRSDPDCDAANNRCAPVVFGDAGGTTWGRQQLRTNERIGRFSVFDTGNNQIGGGMHHYLAPGIIYRIGPYTLNALMNWTKWEGRDDDFRGVNAKGWLIANELYLWSPKGFLTGTFTTPGAVQWGWSFGRWEADCGEGSDCAPGDGAYRQVHLLQREMNLWYTVRAGLRLGLQWNWWESSNTPSAVQTAVGCSNNTAAGNVGKSCDWHTVNATVAFNW